MEKAQNYRFLFLLLAIIPKGCNSGGYCSFPRFLWEPLSDGTPRKWLSKTEYQKNTNTWEKQKEIVVSETEIRIQHKMHANCKGYETESAVPCFRQDIVYEIICVSEEPDGKFRVQQKVNGKYSFNCLQFVRRRNNIIQAYSAVPKGINEDRLCYDVALQRDEWPWIDPSVNDWHFCPFTGGFDLKAFQGDMRQRQCAQEWRSSRVESECVRGEGLTFYFPVPDCSPFLDQVLEKTLYCWGDWVEGSYRYIMLAEEQKLPKFVLRLPKDMEHAEGKFHGYLYFGLVVPISGRGNPPGTVFYLELRMQRSAPGVCYDEGDDCRNYAREGKCTNSALHQYANFCMKSCGLCDFAPSARPECRFPANLHGHWVMYERDAREELTFEEGHVTSSSLGRFICKSKHWQDDFFKVLSTYDNGCRPRYSCIHAEESGSLLMYRISSSALSDQSFKICEFKDDPKPLGDRIRSARLKTLLPFSSLQFGSCGLGGIVHVNTTFSDWLSCDGTMADIDYVTCEIQEFLRLKLHQCKDNDNVEFICEAYAHLPQGTSLLVTRTTNDDTGDAYWCWIIKADRGRKTDKPWRETYQFARASCSTGKILHPPSDLRQLTEIETYDDRIEKPCGHLKHSGYDRPFSKLMPSSSQLASKPDTHESSVPGSVEKNGIVDSAPSQRRKHDINWSKETEEPGAQAGVVANVGDTSTSRAASAVVAPWTFTVLVASWASFTFFPPILAIGE